MKVIEAMKRVKGNKEKIAELQDRIAKNCANLSHETPVYGNETSDKLSEWAQSCNDLTQENIKLLCSIQRTNLQTDVTIELGGNQVTKKIAEWVWRRREYATMDLKTWSCFTDRGLKEGHIQSSTGNQIEIKIVRHFSPEKRDTMRMMFSQEPKQIDAALEVINAVTDLVE